MPFIKTEFPDLMVFEPVLFGDDRGYFFEAYNEKTFLQEKVNVKFVQDNQAKSAYGVVRGLHFQDNPHAQTKLIRVLDGVILDVVLDMRSNSPSWGKILPLNYPPKIKSSYWCPKVSRMVIPY